MSHRAVPTNFTTAALIIAITSALAIDRHLAVKRLQRRLDRRDAHLAAHALALGIQLATEGRTKT